MNTFFNPNEEIVNWLVDYIDGRTVVEIGSGKGDLLVALDAKGVKVIGIDPLVDMTELSLEADRLTLPLSVSEFNLKNFESQTEGTISIVARPCHSTFVQEYVDDLPSGSTLIYIGFAKNLELDIERELNPVKILLTPDHPDCDIIVEIGSRNDLKNSYEAEMDWSKIDQFVKDKLGEVPQEKIDYLVGLHTSYEKQHHLRERSLVEKYKDTPIGYDRFGRNWSEFTDIVLLGRDVTKFRMVTLDISTYMVGGGHLSNSISIKGEKLVVIEDGKIVFVDPWDKEGRPMGLESYKDGRVANYTWDAYMDRKRTIAVETGIDWLLAEYETLKAKFKEEYGVDLYVEIGSGLQYLLDIELL